MTPSNDADALARLLLATAQGDAGAFEQLYAIASPKLYALLLRILRTRERAEDALQECFVRIWQNAEHYTPERGSPMAWLATIARYRALDLLRARRPEVGESELMAGDDDASPLDAEDLAAGPEQLAAAAEGLRELDDCMEQLPGEQRDIVLLAYYQGYTHTEISRRTGNPMGTVKTWLHRSLIKLRDCLGRA